MIVKIVSLRPRYMSCLCNDTNDVMTNVSYGTESERKILRAGATLDTIT